MKIARDDDPEGAAELARAYDREQQAARRRRKAEEAAVTITARAISDQVASYPAAAK